MDDQWEELFSESKNRKYWKNKTTGEKTWKDPKGAGAGVAPAKEGSTAAETKETTNETQQANDEWEELFSEAKNRKYWKNKRTGEKTWKAPTGAGAAAKATEESKPSDASVAASTTAPGADSDWVELFSEAKNRKYWKNNKTGEKSWNPPSKAKSTDAADDNKSLGSVQPTPSTDGNAQPAGQASEWVEMFSKKNQRKYWKNTATGVSTWNNPFTNPQTDATAGGAAGTLSKTGSFTSLVSALTTAEVPAAAAAPASDWEELFSASKQRKYWKNKVTGKSTWTMPPELANPPTAEAKSTPVAETAAPAESEWIEMFSTKANKKYWKNKVTGKSSWTPPPPPPPIAAAAAPKPVEEKVAEAKVEAKEIVVVADKRFVVFRSVARSPTNPNGLYVFELIGPIANTQIILHEITQETPFLEKKEELLASIDSLALDGAITEARRINIAHIQKIVSNKEVGSLLLVLEHASAKSEKSETADKSADETKTSHSDKENPIVAATNPNLVEEIVLYFHSALLAEQISFLLHFCCYHCIPASPYLPSLELTNLTEHHRLLMRSRIADLFVNASYLTSIPERYIQLELAFATSNRRFYQQLFPADSTAITPVSSSSAAKVPSIRYIPSLPAGQKDIEVTLHRVFPLAGMIVLKVHLHLSSTATESSRSTSLLSSQGGDTQMQSGAWMPCWIQIDYHNKSISFFERGPGQPSTFKIFCHHQSTLLRIHDLTEVQDELQIDIIDAVLAENQLTAVNNDNELELINVSFLFKNVQDLWRWSLSFSAICSMIQWKNNNEFTAPIKLSKYHHSISLHGPSSASSTSNSASTALALEQQTPLRAVVTDGNVLLGLESAIVDRDIIHQLIRYVSLPGYLIHQQLKFLHQQQRILISSKGGKGSASSQTAMERTKGVTEGSLLLSINGLSAVQLPGNTVLKFITDIPDEMVTDMAFIKFTPADFVVNAVEIDHTGFVHHQFFTEAATTTDTGVHPSRGGIVGKKLDVESKNQLHRVLEKKKTFAKQHQDPYDTRTMEEKLLAVHLGSHSNESAPGQVQQQRKKDQPLLTLQQFHLTSFEEIQWTKYRLSITNGRVLITSLHSASGGWGSSSQEVFYRFALNQIQLKVIIHQNKDANDLSSLQEIGLELFDDYSHLILHCMNFKLFRSLLHHLLLGMKLYGAMPLDLPYVYSQSEKWKLIKQQSEGVITSSNSLSTATTVALARKQLLLSSKNEVNQEDIEDNQHKERLRKAASKFSTSGILQQAVLLANLEEEGEGNADKTEKGRAHQGRGGKEGGGGGHRRESVIMSISNVMEDYTDEHRSRSLLQAAEALEETLSSLELPLAFPTPAVIEQNLQELRTMNKSNHQLMAEVMTLHLDLISPMDHLNGVTGVGAGGNSNQHQHQTSNTNQGISGPSNKNPYQGYGDVNQNEEQYDNTAEDNDTDSVVENVNNIDDTLFSTNDQHHPMVTNQPPPPPPSNTATPQQNLARRSSFITGNPIDISQQKPNAPKLTRRASRLSVSIDLSSTNPMNASSPAMIPPPSVTKPTPVKAFSLSNDDQLALKILFLHLRENPADLITTASKINSIQDLAVYAYILVNRVFGQFSSDSLRLCDLIDVAMKYENPILNQSNSSTSSKNALANNASPLINPMVSGVSNLLTGSNNPSVYLDDFTTAASLMSSAVSRAAGIGVVGNGNANNVNPLANSAASATAQQNYHYLYFNEFVQYFSYSLKPTSFSSAAPTMMSPGSFQSPFKSTSNTSSNLSKPAAPSIQSNTLLLLLLYEISQRLDITTFIETVCQDIQLSQIHFPSNSMMSQQTHPSAAPTNTPMTFTVSIQEICQYIIDPITQRLEMLLNENQIPSIFLLMMKKLSIHYFYDVYYLEYLYALIIPYLLHKIMIFYRSHYDENNPIQVANQLNQQIQQMNYLNYMNMMGQQGAAGVSGVGAMGMGMGGNLPHSMMMNNYAANTNVAAGTNPMLHMQEEQLIYMIQYIKHVLLLCFQSASASSSVGTAASANALSTAVGGGGGSGASAVMGANNTIQIHQKIVTLSLSDIAVLSKSKWLLSRCLERFVHTIEDLTRQNVHNYSRNNAASIAGSSSTVHSNSGAAASARSPLASLSHLHPTTGKSKIVEGYMCLRPSELLFLLQLFDLYNLTSSSLLISSSSRQLSQAISILQATDIIGRLSYYALSLPSSSSMPPATPSAASLTAANSVFGGSTPPSRRGYLRLSIDRELTIILEVDHSVTLGKYEGTTAVANSSTSHASKGGAQAHSGQSGGLGHHKSWADLLFEKHSGATHSDSTDSVHPIISNNNNSNKNGPSQEVTSLLDDNNASFFLFPETPVTGNTGSSGTGAGGDSLIFSANSNELQSIQWLINTARITLQYIYENISNLSLQKSKSIIKELTDIHQKLNEKKKLIEIILKDYYHLLMNKDYLFHEKLLLQVSYDLLQYNLQIHTQAMRSQRGGGAGGGNLGNNNNGTGGNAPKRSGSVVGNPTFAGSTINGQTVSGLSASGSYYYDIYYSPLQFALARMLSHLIYQDYYNGKFHFYAEEDKELMIQQFISKTMHLEKQLSIVALTPSTAAISSASASNSQPTVKDLNIEGDVSSGGLLSQRVQQQKGVFGSSTVHANSNSNSNSNDLSSNSSNTASRTANAGILPTTGGMNPLRVILQNVFSSSSSAPNAGRAANLPNSPNPQSPHHGNNNSGGALYTRRIHY